MTSKSHSKKHIQQFTLSQPALYRLPTINMEQSNIDITKLTSTQTENFAILLSEGYDYKTSYQAIISNPHIKNIHNARNQANALQGTMLINVECPESAITKGACFLPFQLKIDNPKRMTILNLVNEIEEKVNKDDLETLRKRLASQFGNINPQKQVI